MQGLVQVGYYVIGVFGAHAKADEVWWDVGELTAGLALLFAIR